MKHYGDITKISGYRVPSVNVVIGGSPCQDLSVAGKRAGLAGERSGLFTEQIWESLSRPWAERRVSVRPDCLFKPWSNGRRNG